MVARGDAVSDAPLERGVGMEWQRPGIAIATPRRIEPGRGSGGSEDVVERLMALADTERLVALADTPCSFARVGPNGVGE